MTAKEKIVANGDYVIEQYKAGTSLKIIADSLGAYDIVVKEFLLENGIEIRSRAGTKAIPQEILEECGRRFDAGDSICTLSKWCGYSIDAIWRYLKKKGFNTNRGCKLRDDPLKNHADEIVARYATGVGIYTIAKEYKSSEIGIQQILKKRGVVIRGMDKYDVDESFFEVIDTEAKAYFLGIMYADGNIDGKHYFRISLTDEEHLYKLKDAIKYEGPISNIPSRVIKKSGYVSKCQYLLCVGRVKMVNGLIDKGCVADKTFKIEFPTERQVPSHLLRHFIRGVFDGDGTVFRFVQGKKLRWHAGFLGTESLLSGINAIISAKCGIKANLNLPYKDCKNIRKLYFSGDAKVLRFLDYLYEDSTIYLDRKYARYQELRASVYTP